MAWGPNDTWRQEQNVQKLLKVNNNHIEDKKATQTWDTWGTHTHTHTPHPTKKEQQQAIPHSTTHFVNNAHQKGPTEAPQTRGNERNYMSEVNWRASTTKQFQDNEHLFSDFPTTPFLHGPMSDPKIIDIQRMSPKLITKIIDIKAPSMTSWSCFTSG